MANRHGQRDADNNPRHIRLGTAGWQGLELRGD
jgi:hypothetical protein